MEFQMTNTSEIVLRSGSGKGCIGDECAGQCARRLVGEKDTKSYACPAAASPIIWAIMVRANDDNDAWRAALADEMLLKSIATSRGSNQLELRRAYRIYDWSFRETMPIVYDDLSEICKIYGLSAHVVALAYVATSFRNLAPFAAIFGESGGAARS